MNGEYLLLGDWMERDPDIKSPIFLHLVAGGGGDKERVDLVQLIVKLQVPSLPTLLQYENGEVVGHQVLLNVNSITTAPENGADMFRQAIEEYDKFELLNAATILNRVLKTDPHHKPALFNMASILHMVELPTLAVHYLETLLALEPDDMIAHTFLWALASTPEARGVAIDAYRRLSSNDLKAAHKLATLTGEGDFAKRGDPAYAQKIYDDMADRFENKLVDHLGYKGPSILRDMLMEVIGDSGADGYAKDEPLGGKPLPRWRVLDLGSGSGLVGRTFRTQQADGQSTHTPTEQDDALPNPVGAPSHTSLDTMTTTTMTTPQSPTTTTATSSPLSERSAAPALPTPSVGAAEGEGEGDEGGDEQTPSVPESPTTSVSPSLSVGRLREAAWGAGPLMAGVDVSARMAELAMRNGGYDLVVCGDLLPALEAFADAPISAGNGESTGAEVRVGEGAGVREGMEVISGSREPLDLVVAADTFIYVGVLGAVFARARRALRPRGGLFIFSVEDLDASPMRMDRSGASTKLEIATHNGIGASEGAGTGEPDGIEEGVDRKGKGRVVVGEAGEVDELFEVGGEEPVGAVPGWGAQLLSSARFAHSEGYIHVLARRHGFVCRKVRREVLRKEGTVPLMGIFFVLQTL